MTKQQMIDDVFTKSMNELKTIGKPPVEEIDEEANKESLKYWIYIMDILIGGQ